MAFTLVLGVAMTLGLAALVNINACGVNLDTQTFFTPSKINYAMSCQGINISVLKSTMKQGVRFQKSRLRTVRLKSIHSSSALVFSVWKF